jgi:hypothetical protein
LKTKLGEEELKTKSKADKLKINERNDDSDSQKMLMMII